MYKNTTTIKACRENLEKATCPTSSCSEIPSQHPRSGKVWNSNKTAAFNPAAAWSTDCLYWETDLPWKSPRHLLLLPVTCSLQFYNSFCKSLEEFSNNSTEGKAKVSLGSNSSEILFLTNEAYYSTHISCYTEYILLLQLSTFEDWFCTVPLCFPVKPVYCNHFQNSGISSARKHWCRGEQQSHMIFQCPTLATCFSFSKHLKNFVNWYSPIYTLGLLDLTAKHGSL